LLLILEFYKKVLIPIPYARLFACINEERDWVLGEKIVNERFFMSWQTHHRVLWETKMLYLSKLGKNVVGGISNMKESNAYCRLKSGLN